LTPGTFHLLFTGLGAGNIGDEAMFLGFSNYYPLPPGSTVEAYDPANPVIRTLPSRFRYVSWTSDRENEEAVKSAETILLLGGTPVQCEWGLEWPMRALARKLRFCRSEGIPVHAVGVGVDALHHREARKIFFEDFTAIESWTVRSPSCRSALLDLGVPPETVAVAADLAWLFSPDPRERSWAETFFQRLGVDLSRPLVGVNVVNERWSGLRTVKAAVAAALDEVIRETGAQVVFLCNETREGVYFDAGAAREVIGMMAGPGVMVPNHYFTPAQMTALLSLCTLTLSQRYHFTLLSILGETASLSFARGQKMVSLLEELGDEPVGTMERCDADLLRIRISSALHNRSAMKTRQQLAARHLKVRAKGSVQFLRRPGQIRPPPVRLASVAELNSAPFRNFMNMLNERAQAWGLRVFTNWSKVWEYPWLWFHGLSHVHWPRTRVMDLGSELSPMPWYLASLGARVTLIECDDRWLSSWDRLSRETGMSVEWRIVPDERLPFPHECFDVVTSFSVIEHQVRKDLAIHEVARVLRPGGLFALSFDICEPARGMTFPEWNGRALTMAEFGQTVWNHPAFDNGGKGPAWNEEDIPDFIEWHLISALHHNYVVGAALLTKRK
jgi:2-polyprenyl-3-methyl-5-hydroxy-6-metoxy-1,4-benzoquinol methylase